MAPADDKDEVLMFAKEATAALEKDRVATLLQAAGAADTGATAFELFRLGYGTGVYDTYDALHKRIQKLASTLRTVYHLLGPAIAKNDDIDVLNDLTEMLAELAGYLVEESDEILAASRLKLNRQSRVPVEIIDGTLPMNQVAAQTFIDIGKEIASLNRKQWSLFCVSNGYVTDKDELPTVEEIRTAINTGKTKRIMPEAHQLPEFYRQYGARQARSARKMYKALEDARNQYRDEHSAAADVLASGLLTKLKNKK